MVWIDLEMTGLDTVNDGIIELASIVTNRNLQIIAESPSYVIHQPDEVMDAMDKWNQKHHSQSGLIDEVRESRMNYAEAEDAMLDFLARHAVPEASPMCGNSVCQDRRFLFRLMPRLEEFFHYRNLDVSTLKELAKRWAPKKVAMQNKQSSHRALDDIRDSIEELKFYRENIFSV